jgi:16S rRNA (cytidine1402-2'-O)-methyltransferase
MLFAFFADCIVIYSYMNEEGKLHMVATPIGNLGDITDRAREVLSEVDRIYAEDTRVTKKLLSLFGITNSVETLHQHSGEMVFERVLTELRAGGSIAYVSDAGTPGISDPGGLLVAYLFDHGFSHIVAVPGASAVTAALSISGLRSDKYLFLGFPPQKNKRNRFFAEVAESHHTVVFYESSHRILKALNNLAEVLEPLRTICVQREITKKFESVYRGTISELLTMSIPEKGEFVVVVEGRL